MAKHHPESTQLKVIARAPFHLYYQGPARRVSAANAVGEFDVMPGHADFFSVMVPGQVDIDTGTETQSFPISNGIIAVRNDEVALFVNM